MKKRALLVLCICVVALALVSFFISSGPSLRVTGTNPKNDSALNPFTPVIITFNRRPPTDKAFVIVSPTTDVRISTNTNNAITIAPTTTFLPLTTYKITVNTKPPYVLSFQTEQVVSNAPGWNDAFTKQVQIYQQQNGAQDAALIKIRKGVPIKLPGFTVDYSYGNNTYAVSLSVPYDVNKRAFLAWLISLGVTDTSSLRIQFINL